MLEDDYAPPPTDFSGRLGRVEAWAQTALKSVADLQTQTRSDMHTINTKLDILVDRDSRRAGTSELIGAVLRAVGVPIIGAMVAAIGFFARPILEFISHMNPPH